MLDFWKNIILVQLVLYGKNEQEEDRLLDTLDQKIWPFFICGFNRDSFRKRDI